MNLYRRALRHATWTILAVWLFALGAGVANACLLSIPSENSHSSAPVEQQDLPAAHTQQPEQPDPGVAGCLKFCDESLLAVTKMDQPIADGSPETVGVAYRAWAPPVASAIAVQLSVNTRRPAHVALPIVARPHRLTL